jgi:hypothetical protein
MRFHSIRLLHGDAHSYLLGGFSGALFARPILKREAPPVDAASPPDKVHAALARCHSPYLFPAINAAPAAARAMALGPASGGKVGRMLCRLIRLCRMQFFLARLYAAWRCPLFDSAREAIAFFRAHAPGDQAELCLARALFAAKTSRRFPSEGVVLIGVFLPARSLHAWVVEAGEIADVSDDLWINFQPVAVLS